MKTLLLTAFAALAISCEVKPEKILPNNLVGKTTKGPVQSKEFNITFDEIKVAESISAEIIKSDTEKVVISAPEEILDDILVENEGGKLYIHFKSNNKFSLPNVAAKIYAKDFTKLEANSSASIVLKDQFTQDKTEVHVSSSGDISGDLEANDLKIGVSSAATFKGKVWAVNLQADTSSSGDLKITGKTKNAVFNSSSGGSILAEQLIAQNAEIRSSSGGDILVSVSDQLNASASSGGDVTVIKKGNLQIVNQNTSSGGQITVR